MAKRKERTRGIARSEEKFTCPNSSCGFVFSKPIKVKNLCEDTEVYDACPRCFTALSGQENAPVIEAQPSSIEDMREEKPSRHAESKKPEPLGSSKCTHKFGYLSERPKNEKIPDECMTCENIVKCMLKGMTG